MVIIELWNYNFKETVNAVKKKAENGKNVIGRLEILLTSGQLLNDSLRFSMKTFILQYYYFIFK